MTTEIEKQFFDTFGIEPSNMCKYAKYGYEGTEGTWYFCAKNQKECWTYPSDTGCKDKMTSYPEITDRILLELICLNNIYLWETHTSTVNELKNVLLNKYIEYVNLMADENEKQEYINQVQSLFKENN